MAKLKECFSQNEFDQILLSLGANTIWSADDTCSAGTKNILAALKETTLKPRIIMCGSMGVNYEEPGVNWFVKWMLKYPLADKVIQERLLNESGFPVVIVRPGRLMDLPGRGLSKVAAVDYGAVPFGQIARVDVASFMIA